jgi:hypothetical protein
MKIEPFNAFFRLSAALVAVRAFLFIVNKSNGRLPSRVHLIK